MAIVTLMRPVFSAKSTSTPNFVPMTRALDATGLDEVLLGVLLESRAAENVKVQPAYRWSDDGESWGSVYGVDLDTNPNEYTATTGEWVYKNGVYSLETQTPKLYVQLGLQVLNTSGTKTEGGIARLSVQPRPFPYGTYRYPWTKVNTRGDATEIFTPFGPAVPADQVSALRAAFEVIASSGSLEVGPSYQVSLDGRTWRSTGSSTAGTFDNIGSATRTTDGVTYPTTFPTTGLSLAFPYIRFGMRAKNTGGNTDVNACLVRLRVDWR